jgi:hypothetical protein
MLHPCFLKVRIQNRMQEIKKRRIVIASVLKPVDDTRMFEKIAGSLSERHDVHVIGFGAPGSAVSSSVKQYPIGTFPRISLRRILAPWRILRRILPLKPDLLIICTHELLYQAMIAKMVCGCRVWYDVQENYARNILYTNAYPWILRPVLAGYVRAKERIFAVGVERFLLAEQTYADEMKYLRGKAVTLENKIRKENIRQSAGGDVLLSTPRPLRMIFSGTLSKSTGVFAAIRIAEAINALHPVRLTIVGFCPRPSERDQLISRCRNLEIVELISGPAPLPYELIRNAIENADLGIISYPPSPATWMRMPTKLYEYIGHRLPFLLINNSRWMQYAARFPAAVAFDADHFEPATTLSSLRSTSFYSIDPQDVYWEQEAQKLTDLI